jgi:CheY-like chemotaxis protein
VPISLPNDVRHALRAHFRLLVNKPVHHDALFALLSGSRSSAPPIQPTTHFGFRVLVIEDNPVDRRLIQRVLANLGCTPILVEEGRKAVAELAGHAADFDIVFLDLQLPEMDGLTALREIRAGEAGVRAQTMWIIALTADEREQQRLRAMEPGLDDYLAKPLTMTAVETAFKRFRTERLARKR